MANKSKSNKPNTFWKYKKLFMIILVLVAIVVCVSATYITTYNNNKVTAESAFATSSGFEPTGTKRSQAQFESNFSNFKLYQKTNRNPVWEDGKIESYGSKIFVVNATLEQDSNFRGTTFNIRLVLGADWVGYTSTVTSASTVTVGKEKTISMGNLDKLWPVSGNLWFVKVDQPTLYAYVEWTEYLDGQSTTCYSFLSYSYNTYSVVPEQAN